MVFLTKLGFENLKNLVWYGIYIYGMVYMETFLRNFKFYAKTLTKLHDLTVLEYNPILTGGIMVLLTSLRVERVEVAPADSWDSS